MKLSLTEFFIHEEGEMPKGDEPLARPKGSKKFKNLPKGDEPLKQEHADPTDVVDAGSTIWSDPSQPAKVKKFSSKGGVLNIDLQEMFTEATPDDWQTGAMNTQRSHGNYNFQKNSAGKYRTAYSSRGNPGREEVLPGVYGSTAAAADAGNLHHQNVMNLRGMKPDGTGGMVRDDGRRHKNMVRPANTGRGRGVFEGDLAEMFGMEEGGEGSGRAKGSKNKASSKPVVPGKPVDPSTLPDDLDDFDIDVDDSAWDPEPAAPAAAAPAAEPAAGGEEDTFSRGEDDFGDDLSWLDDPSLGAGAEVPKAAPAAPKVKKPRMAGPDDTERQASPEHQAWLDSQNFEFDKEKEEKDGGQFWKDHGEDAMSWEDLEEAEPDIAADIAAEYPDLADPGHFMDDPKLVKRERGVWFAFDKTGDLIMRMNSNGARYKWEPENAEWIPMDEGN